MRIAIAVTGFALLVGCATSPISADKATPVPENRLFAYKDTGPATLVVTRDSGMYMAGCNYRLYIDGQLAGEFAAGEGARFGIGPGKHVLGLRHSAACGGWGLVEREIEVSSGEIVRRRITFSNNAFDIFPTAI